VNQLTRKLLEHPVEEERKLKRRKISLSKSRKRETKRKEKKVRGGKENKYISRVEGLCPLIRQRF